MQKTKAMDLNRETAMRLWTKSFGKENKVKDYTGRTIAKGAYNDRNSEFGWNLDHILPQSRGGKTADYNLICCHILTNDEKADKFPGFKANGITFEIVKVENHYEIQQVGANKKKKTKEEDSSKVNFMDSASGVRFFKNLKGIQNKPRFVGTVFIRLKNIQTTALIDFIEKLYGSDNITYSMKEDYSNSETQITIKNYDMPLKSDTQDMLDKCIVLNTYLKYYFTEADYVDGYDIYYRVDHYREKWDMYLQAQDIRLTNQYVGIYRNFSTALTDKLYINGLVISNTDAEDDVEEDQSYEFTEYDYTYTKLKKNLEKEVSGK